MKCAIGTIGVLIFAIVEVAGVIFGQPIQKDSCQLSTFADGQIVTLHGKAVSGSHDLMLTIDNCQEAVVLDYAGDASTGDSATELQHTKSLSQFRRYTSTEYKGTRKNGCTQCSMYEVEAILNGTLSVASDNIPEGQWKDKLGMLHDNSGKFVGNWGFGHPPIYKYRLVIKSASRVVARKLPRAAR